MTDSWGQESFNLSYTCAYVPGAPTSFTVDDLPLELPVTTRPYHSFGGWYDNSDLTGDPVTAIPAGTAQDVTLYASWIPEQHTITFDSKGGSAVASITQGYGTAITAPADPTRDSYTFVRWSQPIPATMPADDMTLNALWDPINYNIAYDLNGGTLDGLGYTMEAWFVEDELPPFWMNAVVDWSGSWIGNWMGGETIRIVLADAPASDISIQAVVSMMMPAVDESGEILKNATYSGTIPVDDFLTGGAITLTTQDGYDPISFNWSVASGGLSNPTSYNIETQTFTLVNPVLNGAAFAGWTVGDDDTPEATVTIPRGSKGTLSFKAHWSKDFTTCIASVPNPVWQGEEYYIGWSFELEGHGGIVVTDVEGNELTYGEDYVYWGTESLEPEKYEENGDWYGDLNCAHPGEQCRVTLEGCGDWQGTLTADIVISLPHHEGDGWSYEAGVLSISGSGAIPAQRSFQDYPWYEYGRFITDIVIGEGITSVPYAAFGGNSNVNPYTNVKTVTLPTTLTDIGECAFAYCGLETINLDYVQTIVCQAFNRCRNLSVVVPAMAKHADGTADTVKSVDPFAFEACDKVTFAIAIGDTENGTVTAMVNNSAVEAAAVNVAVTLAVEPAEDCELESMTYTPVGDDCDAVEISADAETGEYAFIMPRQPVIVNAVFRRVFGTPNFTLPADTTTIEESAFEDDSEMVIVDAGSVTFIDKWAFRGCTALKQIKLPENCEIASDAFSDCEEVYVFAPQGGSTQAYCEQTTNPCVFVEMEETVDED